MDRCCWCCCWCCCCYSCDALNTCSGFSLSVTCKPAEITPPGAVGPVSAQSDSKLHQNFKANQNQSKVSQSLQQPLHQQSSQDLRGPSTGPILWEYAGSRLGW